MSDTTAPAPEAPKPTPPAQAPDAPPKVETDWEAEAKKWEKRAKDNFEKAQRLDQIEESTKTEAQKSAERLAAAEKAASEAEAKVLRRDIAIEHKLSTGDAALLDTITDEAAMRSLAARLAPSEDDGKPRTPRPDPNQGRSGTATASTGDLFAATVRDLIR